MANTECPQCHNALQVPENAEGKLVKCPLCHNTFTPTPASFAPAPMLPKPPPLPMEIARPKDAWDDEEEPERRPARRRRRFEDDDVYDDDLDISRGRREKAHRGAVVLTLAIVGLVLGCLGIILGPIAWIMGSNDLKEMAAGRMDRSGEGVTRAGQIIGMVTTFLWIAAVCFYVVIGAVAVLSRR
jgi:hypothetical protein